MALNAATIKVKLSSVSWNKRDDEARNMINAATAAELKGLDAEAVLRLYDGIRGLGTPGIYSSDDQKAMKRLAAETQFQPVKTPDFGVDLVKNARPSKLAIQSELAPDLVARIYAAENKRLSWYEHLGADGATIGRGQLGQAAYTDVGSAKHFKAELEKCLNHDYISKIVNAPANKTANESYQYDSSTFKFRIPTAYSIVWRNPVLEDFVVAAYLAIRIEAATKPGRTTKDAARFAVALYHGMSDMVRAAQKTVKDDINWAPVETHLRSQGKTDECDYVNEVVI